MVSSQPLGPLLCGPQLALPEARIPELPEVLERASNRVFEMQRNGYCACMVRMAPAGGVLTDCIDLSTVAVTAVSHSLLMLI